MENPPFSIQQSIEEPFEGWQPWDQPVSQPVSQQRYSTAWSDRTQSIRASLCNKRLCDVLEGVSLTLQALTLLGTLNTLLIPDIGSPESMPPS